MIFFYANFTKVQAVVNNVYPPSPCSKKVSRAASTGFECDKIHVNVEHQRALLETEPNWAAPEFQATAALLR